jgi:hypothetical protein
MATGILQTDRPALDAIVNAANESLLGEVGEMRRLPSPGDSRAA